MSNFVTRKIVLETLNIHYNTLQNLVKRKEIEYVTIGRKRSYNLNKYIRDNNIQINKKENICYCRVSSKKQSEDLERQIEYMRNLYPNYRIISDIGSGLNFNRRGLIEIINMAINSKLENLIIAYKDRLARFGYELIEYIIKNYSNGKITIINKTEESTPLEEVSKDIISIMNIYVAKVNGMRKYKKPINDVKKCFKENCKNM
jgi:predicted site-specific integrase-resolvase